MEHIHVPWLLFLCGLGPDQPDGPWLAKSGMRLDGSGEHGTPFGRSRIALLVLAEKAAQMGRFVEFSIAEILEMFGLDWRARTIEEHVHRVLDCTYEMVEERCACQDARCRPKRTRSVPFIVKSGYCVKDRTFHVELRDEFVAAARQSPLCSIDAIKALLRDEQLAALDLYCWYQWKLFREDYEDVDPLGPDGPFGLLPIATHARKAFSVARKLHAIVRQAWPDCPFRVVRRKKQRRIVYGTAPLAMISVPTGLPARKASQAAGRMITGGTSVVLRTRRRPAMQATQRPSSRPSSIGQPVPPLAPLPPLPPVRSMAELCQEAERMQARLEGMAASRARGDPPG